MTPDDPMEECSLDDGADAKRRRERFPIGEASPLISIKLQNWPPADLGHKQRARLIALILRDFERTLRGVKPTETPSRITRSSKPMAAMAADSTIALPPSRRTDDRAVDCKMTGWGYEIVEINGVPTECRVEYYACTDGTTYRREYPI